MQVSHLSDSELERCARQPPARRARAAKQELARRERERARQAERARQLDQQKIAAAIIIGAIALWLVFR